uniref:Uncharacterized protein n=1 Tax=Setaria italica TaxID=4555 RepID=K3XNJ3_SETIT
MVSARDGRHPTEGVIVSSSGGGGSLASAALPPAPRPPFFPAQILLTPYMNGGSVDFQSRLLLLPISPPPPSNLDSQLLWHRRVASAALEPDGWQREEGHK